MVDASTYGVGNAFAGLTPAPTPVPPRGARSGKKELLVVDGYNVIHATPKYEQLMFDRGDHPYSSDVYERARMALIGDVAAFAGRQYEAVVVFDAAGNVSPDGAWRHAHLRSHAGRGDRRHAARLRARARGERRYQAHAWQQVEPRVARQAQILARALDLGYPKQALRACAQSASVAQR